MPGSKKKRRVARPQDSSDSNDNSENRNDRKMEIVEVMFDVRFPESTDRHGIINLLQQLFLKAHINTSELADLLIEQSNITGVTKVTEDDEDEDDMNIDDDMDCNFGVFSIVNLTEKKNMECVKQIRTYLLHHCKEVASKNDYETFKSVLGDDSKHVGLIISERASNFPAKIAVPLYGNLRNDMNKAIEKKEAYDFAYYVRICRTVNFTASDGSANNQENIIYLNPEEELLDEEAELSFEFQVETEQDTCLNGRWRTEDEEGLPERRVLLIPANKWDTMFNKLIAELGPDLQQQC